MALKVNGKGTVSFDKYQNINPNLTHHVFYWYTNFRIMWFVFALRKPMGFHTNTDASNEKAQGRELRLGCSTTVFSHKSS